MFALMRVERLIAVSKSIHLQPYQHIVLSSLRLAATLKRSILILNPNELITTQSGTGNMLFLHNALNPPQESKCGAAGQRLPPSGGADSFQQPWWNVLLKNFCTSSHICLRRILVGCIEIFVFEMSRLQVHARATTCAVPGKTSNTETRHKHFVKHL